MRWSDLTPAEQELAMENFTDQWWRLNNLYRILDADANDVPFRPNSAQIELYEGLWYQNLILKARQRGITTMICLLFLDACLFNSNTQSGIVAHNKEDAQEFFHNKIKFAYDRLPGWLRERIPADTDTTRQLRFSNGSSIRVGTSLRSGTLQYLHISEFGKICAKYPEKAREIVTGSLNTVHPGQFIFIESTAEGRHGYFYDFCKVAQDLARQGKKLTPLDFKFFFFPWWDDVKCSLAEPDGVAIPANAQDYFNGLQSMHGIDLTNGQRAWYVKKAQSQQEDMYREFPSTPEEAFSARIKGAYYALQMAKLRSEKRLCRVPYEAGLPVNTAWDLGMSDSTAIWFHQRCGPENRIIDYYENSGESLQHYAKVLQDRGYVYGEHYLPHDVSVREMGTGKSRLEQLEALGLRNILVIARELTLDEHVGHGIDAVRTFLNTCWMDEEKCAVGIAALDAYQKEWDDKHGCFRERPLHNWAEHGASAFRMLALGYAPRRIIKGKKTRRRDGRVV